MELWKFLWGGATNCSTDLTSIVGFWNWREGVGVGVGHHTFPDDRSWPGQGVVGREIHRMRLGVFPLSLRRKRAGFSQQRFPCLALALVCNPLLPRRTCVGSGGWALSARCYGKARVKRCSGATGVWVKNLASFRLVGSGCREAKRAERPKLGQGRGDPHKLPLLGPASGLGKEGGSFPRPLPLEAKVQLPGS